MWRNLKLFEDNHCGNVFNLLNEYLNDLNLKQDNYISLLKEALIKLNKINKNDINPENFFSLLEEEKEYVNLFKNYKLNSTKIQILNNVMSNYILDDVNKSKFLFENISDYFISKEEYEKCTIIKKVLNLL